MSISIKCFGKPKYYKEANVLVLNIEITNGCFFTKKDLKVSICPSDSGDMEKSFEQRLFARKDSFIAGDIPVNAVNNDFILPFTLKSRQSKNGNVIIALKNSCCQSIQVVSSKGKVLSELAINNNVEKKPFII